MASTSSRLGLPYPVASDPANVPQDVHNLVNALDGDVVIYYQTNVGDNSTPPTTVKGSIWYCAEPSRAQYGWNFCDGSAWQHGPMGPQGPQGTTGATGVQGATGPQGTTGATGAQGPVGNQGVQGASGATGPNGTQGFQGSSGAQGATGATGVTGPAGATGAGVTGATGPQGATGALGATGATGANGTNGTNGATGATGPIGLSGNVGPTGPTGAAGGVGATGATGAAPVSYTHSANTSGAPSITTHNTFVGINSISTAVTGNSNYLVLVTIDGQASGGPVSMTGQLQISSDNGTTWNQYSYSHNVDLASSGTNGQIVFHVWVGGNILVRPSISINQNTLNYQCYMHILGVN